MLGLYVLNVSKIFRVANDDFLNLACNVGVFLAANIQSFFAECLTAVLERGKKEVGWGKNEISTKRVVDRRKKGRGRGRGKKIRLPEVIVLLGNSVCIYL